MCVCLSVSVVCVCLSVSVVSVVCVYMCVRVCLSVSVYILRFAWHTRLLLFICMGRVFVFLYV